MARFIMKSKVKDKADLHVGREFYDRLDTVVGELIEEAERRAESNDRRTLYARDL